MHNNNDSAQNSALPVTMFLLGAGIGVGLGILFAPRNGRAIRSEILSSAENGVDYLAQQRDVLTAKAQQIVEQGKTNIQRQQAGVKAGVKAAMDAGVRAYQAEVGVASEPSFDGQSA